MARDRRPLQQAAFSFGAVWLGESTTTVALAVVAYLDGGVTAVGVVTAVRMAAAALVAPAFGTVGDRVRRERLLAAIGLVRALTLGGAAAVTALGGAVVVTYALVVVATVALALYRPTHSALLPALARSPADLTAANAVRGTLDSAATLVGPLAAAGLLALTGPAVVLGVGAAVSLAGGLAVVRLAYDPPPRRPRPAEPVTRAVVAGVATVGRDRTLRLVTALGMVQTFTRGCLAVFTVLVAVDLLGLGEPGVGWLTAAVGAGGLLGSFAAFTLVRRGGLATWYGIGIALFGAPLAVLGVLPSTVAATLLLALVGVGNALIDVAAFTVLARVIDETVLVRAFTGFEALLTLGVAVGGLTAPLVVEALGTRAALVAVGLLAPVAVLTARPALARLDRALWVRADDVAVLRAVPMLAVLPATTVEQLAASLTRRAAEPGETVVAEGEPGEAYFVVEHGRAEVVRRGTVVTVLGPGDGFGEIALLDDRPRTATVRAAGQGPLLVAALPRAAFLTAVTGYPVAATAGAREVARVTARDAEADRE